MERVLYPEGVDVSSTDDLTGAVTLTNAEIVRRWRHVVTASGIVARQATDNVLFPTTGSTSGTIEVSAGGAYTPGGEYVLLSGTTSITGLTNVNMTAATIYVAVMAVDTTGATRRHAVTGAMLPTRAWNAGDATALGLVSGATGSAYTIIGRVTNITAAGAVTLDASAAYRPLVNLSDTTPPAGITGVTVDTGLIETDLIYASTGTPAKAEGLLSEAYVTAVFDPATHSEGLLGYLAELKVFDDSDAELTGRTLTQMLYVGGHQSTGTTGLTFYGVTPGLRAQVVVTALSNSPVPIPSTGTPSSMFYTGSLLQSTTPAVTVTQKSYGMELSWNRSDSGASGITLFEVFASTDASVTGASVDYSLMVWRGFGSRAPVLADLGDTIYYQVRGIDGRWQIATSARTGSAVITGPSVPGAPKNLLVYSGVEQNSNRTGSRNLAAPQAKTRISSKVAHSANRPYIEARWGWEGSSGAWTDITGSTRQFDLPTQTRLVDSSGSTVDVTGWYLVFQAYDAKRFYHPIVSNTESTVETSPVAGYDYEADHTGSFWITPGADEYEVSVQLVQLNENVALSQTTGGGYEGSSYSAMTDPVTQTPIKHVGRSTVGSSPVDMRYRYENPIIGAAYAVRARSRNRNTAYSTWSASRVVIAGIGTQVTMSSVQYQIYGTRVTFRWKALSDALGYEVAYTTDGSDPSFDSDDSNLVFAYRNTIDILVQAGDTLTAIFRAVDVNGQVSSNSVRVSVSVGVPSGYYGVQSKDLNLQHITSANPEYQTVDFPFPFTVRYLSLYVSSASGATSGDSVEFRVYPYNEPDSERNIAIDWTGAQTGTTIRQEGEIAVRGDGAITLRIDSSDATPGITLNVFISIWYEQTDITPPGGDGGTISPRSTAVVKSKGSFSTPQS